MITDGAIVFGFIFEYLTAECTDIPLDRDWKILLCCLRTTGNSLLAIQETKYNNYVLARWSGVKTYQRLYGDDGRTCPRQQAGEEGRHVEQDQVCRQRASMQKSRRHTRPTR